jgi:uncharacterized protein YgbK (DUF1537 family)
MGDELSMQTQIIILDDDPTGIQTVHGCLALTCWDAETLCRAFEDACPFFYVLTNTRAYAREQARQIVVDAVQAIVTVNRAYQRRLVFISRSDSTLRSHFPLEIDSITQRIEQDTGQPMDAIFLVPAFFEGGRITRDDTHYLWDGCAYIPTSDTEFARDAVFGYTSSHLPTYIEKAGRG